MKRLFKSFWMGGFECCDMLNRFGTRLDLLVTTGHLRMISEDYEKAKKLGIHTVREGIRWSHVEKRPFEYDWADFRMMLAQGKKWDIQQIWDICHFGFPDDLSPLHPHFADRFAALCVDFVKTFRQINPNDTLIVTPINEVSYLSWLGGDEAGTTPYCRNEGWSVKYALMRAYILAVKAMKETDEKVLILTTEPLVNIVPTSVDSEEDLKMSLLENELQFQVLDMLTGRLCPELGGNKELVNIIGLNYYYNNQWILGTFEFLPWKNEYNDLRWKPLSDLVTNVYDRYRLPMILSETSHPKEHRPYWLDFILHECRHLTEKGIPLWGLCWYPIIDRPDWDDQTLWHQAGLWDVLSMNGATTRKLHEPTAAVWLKAQEVFLNV